MTADGELADQHGLASLSRVIDLTAEVAKGKLEFSQLRDGIWSGAAFEPPAFIAGLDDIAMMRQAVE